MGSYKLLNFKIFGDSKGSLVAIEPGKNLPFEIKRVYYIFNTKEGVERGFHAHLSLKQVVLPVRGSCTFLLDDGMKKKDIKLDKPNKGLFIDGMIWREMKNFSHDCVLMVLASERYNINEYIKDYKKFLKIVRR